MMDQETRAQIASEVNRADILDALADANEAMVLVYMAVPTQHLESIKGIQTGILTLMRQIKED